MQSIGLNDDGLQEAQGSLTSLNATIDQLQQLADKLDPLATAHAEVRFLDVEFEQLEKHFGDVLDQMHNEIEQEKALMAETERAGRETDDMTAQLPTMANNLKALQHAQQTAIPALEAKVVMLQQQSEKEKPLRQYVFRSTAAPSPDELAQRIALSKGRAQEAAQQLVDTAVARVQNVLLGTSQAAAELPSDQQIDECAKELQDNIPPEHPHNEQLRQQLEQLREKVMRRDAIRSQIDQHLATIGKELEGFSEQFISTSNGKKVPPPSSKKEAKKKKGKGGEPEQQKRAEKMASREEHIDELQKALGRLESGILPALNTLHDEAVQQGIPLQPTEEHQHQLMRANQIVQSLKVCENGMMIFVEAFIHFRPFHLQEDLDKSVAENERASVVINDIRLLKSIVDGTVVEAETAAEEATLQLLLDVESVEQHKRDMEEAAKKLGEQLAKMAADAHELSTSLEPEEQALMKRVEEEAGKKMDRLNSLNSVLQQQMEVLRDWARDKDRLEQHTCSLIDQLKRMQEEREEAGPAPAEEELAKLDALQSEVDEARDEMKRMQSWLVQKLPKCGRAAVELQLRPVEESLVKLNTDMDGTKEQLKKHVQIERSLLQERTALLNAANELDEQVRQAHALEEPQEQISELDKLHNQLERVEQQMRTVDQQSEQYPTPQKATTLSEQIAHVVHKTKTNIGDARHQLEERIAQNARKEQLRDRAVRLDASLTALVNQAHDKLNESAAMPQCYEQLCNGLAEQIELAEQFGAENGITVGGEERIAQAKEVREQLAQRWHHWGEFVRLRDLGTAQLDKARVAIDQTEQKACRSLAEAESDHDNLLEAQGSLTSLNATIDQLQQLADKLDPLATAHAEVRFLDVEFEQLEKHFGDVLDQMHNEIEQEKALMAETERAGRETDDMTAQLPTMANNLKALQHAQQTAIPALEAKVVMLQQQSEKEKPLRQYVFRSTAAPSPDELAQRIALSKGRAQEAAQQLVDTAVARVQNVLLGTSQAAAELPSDQQIDECAKELQDNIPPEHPHNEQLRQQLEQLREKVMRRDAIRSQIDQHLATIGKELEGFSEQFISTSNGKKVPPPSSKKEAKKKKGKGGEPEQQKRAEKMASREEHIDELQKALGRLESGILPALNTLHDEAVQQGIPLQPTEEHQHQLMRANQIVQSLKEDLDKSVAENERASVVINDIRLLKSIVDGTVVEAETAAEEATLQLLLDVESVEQHKRDMEEAAKKLGEQLAKMAADAHELSTSLEPEEQALMKRVEEEAGKKMDRLNSLNSVLQQQMEVLRDWARDKDRLEQHTCSLIDQLKRMQEEREEAGPAPAEEELAKLDALQSEVDEARDEMKRMQSWLVQKLPKCGRAAVELQLRPVEESLVKLNTDMDGTKEQLKKHVQIERSLLQERTALLNAANELDEQISELDKLHNQLERVEQQMRTVDQQSEQYPTPQKATTLSEQIAHVVHKTKTNIEDARHQQEERIAQNARKEQLRDRAVRLDASLTALVNQAHDKLNESAAMPQCYEQLCNGLAEQIELAEQFGAENGITVGGEERIAQAKEVREQLAQRWHHWGEFVRLRDLGTAQLDKARVAIDQTEQKACRSLAEAESDHDNLLEAQGSLTSLNATIDQLQQLADKLDPLATAHAEVRFLDVEFEQLEKHFGDVLDQMHNEIEQEKALMAETERAGRETDDMTAQLPTMANNLKALQHAQQTAIPALEAKVVMLQQQSEKEKPLRQYVFRSTAAPSPDELAQRIALSKGRAQEAAQQLVDTAVARVQNVLLGTSQAAAELPSDQQIDECAKELQDNIPLEHPHNEQLRQHLEQLREKVMRRDAIRSQIDQHLATIGKELEGFSEQFISSSTTNGKKVPPSSKKEAKKKKGKGGEPEQQKRAEKMASREEHIDELRKALGRLESGILPALNTLHDEAVQQGIPLQPTEEHQHQLMRANQIVQSLKEDLDKSVAENERASVVINDIRLLKSIVDGTVVEAETAAEEATLQLLDVESVEQHKRDMEEAAKKLGEQLAKMAADAHELSTSLEPEEQALMKRVEEEAGKKMDRLNSLNSVLQQQMEVLRDWARDKDRLEQHTCSLIDQLKRMQEEREEAGPAPAEEELAKLDALQSEVDEARDEMKRMQSWLVQKLPKCGRAAVELQLRPVEESLVKLNTDMDGTKEQLKKHVQIERSLLQERTALLNAANELDEQVRQAHALEEPQEQISELDKLHNQLERVEQQMRTVDQQSEQYPTPQKATTLSEQIAHVVHKTKTNIEDARHQQEERIAQNARKEQLRDRAVRLDASLTALVNQAHDKLNESAAMPQCYEQLCNGLAEQIELAEQFGAENGITVGGEERIAQAKEVREQLAQRWHHWGEFVRLRDLGTAQLDKARVAIDQTEQKACRSLAEAESDHDNLLEAQGSLTSLNATIDQLQQLADKLDPLATAHAEVRFLDVEFEQLEKHFGDVLDQMHNEIEQEKALMAETERAGRETDDMTAQLPTMANNLKALQHAQQTAIPALEAKVVMLQQQSEKEKPLRQYVFRSTAAPSPDELAQRIALSKGRAQEAAQQLVDTAVARVQNVLLGTSQAAAELPFDQQIDECAKELQDNIPPEHPHNEQLRQQLEQLREKVMRRDAIRSQIDQHLATIGKELEGFSEQFISTSNGKKVPPPSSKKEAKKKKGKGGEPEQQKRAEKMASREEHIDELQKALGRLESGILPALNTLHDEAVQQGIPLQPTEEHQHQLMRANQIVQSLKEDLDKSVAENERASVVINDIRLLKSIVDGTVVEAETAAEEATLQLLLDVESVEQHKRDMEEAAKKLGEQLAKMAADAHELSTSLEPEEQALMKRVEEEAGKKMDRLNSLNSVLQQQMEVLRDWARDKDRLEQHTCSLIDQLKRMQEEREEAGPAPAEEELAKLDALQSEVDEARDEMKRMQSWLVQKLPKCGRAAVELQLRPVEESLVKLNTDMDGTKEQLKKHVQIERSLLQERTALLNAANELDEQVRQAHALEEPQEQISELDKLHNQLERVEQQMRTVDQQSEQYPTPQKATTLSEQIAHVVHKTKTNIEDARHQQEERIAQNARKEQLRDRAVRLDASLTALVNQAHDKLNESAAMPQCYEQLCNGLAEQIELAEQFGAENGITVGGEERIAQAKEVREQLAQRWHHWGEFVRLRDLGTAQLDKARVAIDQTEQKACRSLAEAESDHDNLLEAQGSLTSLNATIDQLQQLADKLDPLATAHAEVRFLDVEFEQLEKHFGDVLDQMHNEIEQEKALMAETERAGRETDDMTAQLPTMANNLKALQHAQQTAIPALEAKVVMLQQQSEKEKPLRQYVFRSTAAPSPDELAQRIALSKGRAQEAAQQLVDTAVARVQNVLLGTSQAAAELPSDQQIDECAKELQDNIPPEHPHNEQLRQQLEQLREKVMRRDAIRSQIDQHLATIGKELEGFSEQFISTSNGKKVPPPSSKKEAKKKKGKGGEPEQQKRAEKMASREEHIDELQKALGRLESGILPALNTLHDEAVQQGIPLQPTEEHQHQLMRANQIVQSLKEDLDKSVAENERASVVINDIRLLKSIVDGTVVEAETAAEEATLQLLLDVESVEQHKRDMEEAAKKLGEQLAKMAADAHELSTSLEPEEQALMKRVEEEAGKKMDRLNSLNSVLQQQMEVLRDWARDKDRLEQHTCSLIDQLKRMQEEREEAGPAPAEEELAKLDALQSEVDEARDEMKRMQSWLVQKLPKCGRAAVELQLRPVEESLVKLNTDMDGTKEQLKKHVQIERSLLQERTALLNAANELDEQVRQAHALEEPQEQISELDKLHNQLERVEQQMRTVDQQSEQYPTPQKATTLSEQIAHVVHKTKTNIEDARHQLEERIAQNARKEQLRDRAVRLDASLTALVNQAHDKLNESAAMPQCYEQLCNGLAEQIELAEQFGAENGITVGGEERIAQAKEVREQLAQRWHHWGEFVRLRDLGTALLDEHRNSLDNVRSAPLISELSDAQLQLSSLKDNSLHFSQIRQLLSDLVSLSKSLSPLSVVDDILRFMFVELESLESANEQIVHQFEAEIEHGNELEQMFDGIASNVRTFENNFDHFLQLRNTDRMNDLLTELGETGAQIDQLEQSIWQGNDQQRIFVQSFDKKRLQILRERIGQLKKNIWGAFSELSEGPSTEAAEEQPKYDVDAAVEILSAIYPGREPLEVMREHGLDKLELDMNDDYGDGQTEGEEDDFLAELSPQPSRPSVSSKDSSISPVPDDPSHAAGAQQRPMAQLQQQQSRWRRVLRTALPLQAMLVLLLGAACLVPHCDDEYCCHLLNNFARSFDPQLHFANGPPPF
ncbi:hypothetical protein niasHT_007741 [Heterodera trifolii]|uniref:KASH domain-containing protein n=1 Tax=Heterodera trifolii TaxID=157864 RepID=A0ABD2MAE1_9BILA